MAPKKASTGGKGGEEDRVRVVVRIRPPVRKDEKFGEGSEALQVDVTQAPRAPAFRCPPALLYRFQRMLATQAPNWQLQLLQPANQRQYRTKMFLATSFNPQVADDFLNDPRNNQPGRVKVRFIIRYDDNRRCMHVNYIEASHSEAPIPEDEFLFAPYSAFTVQQIQPPTPGVIDYYQITILAAHENREFDRLGNQIPGGASEVLPLAGWH